MRVTTTFLGVGGVGLGLVLCCAAGRLGAQEPELLGAFIFGARVLDCESPNADVSYTVVHQSSPAAVAYDPSRGYGYEVVYPTNSPYGSRDGYGVYGPFDSSPNDRNAFSDSCPEQIYDSFIGAKDFLVGCSDPDPDLSCEEVGQEPEGIIFRVDVCNGDYRFVAVVGSADNAHTHRILVENGGEGPPPDISDDYVVLVNNYDQGERGAGTFAHVGFDDYLAPEAIGPGLTSMDAEGFAIDDDDPDSPTLEVTEGYIRIHQLQGNNWTGSDPNGGNMVLLELWRVGGEGPCVRPCVASRELSTRRYQPGETVSVTVSAEHIQSATTITETFPAGWTVANSGGGTVNNNAIAFEITADGELTYELSAPPDFCEAVEITGTIANAEGCAGDIGGDSRLSCLPEIEGDLVIDFDESGPSSTDELLDWFEFRGFEPDVGSNWTVDENPLDPEGPSLALHTVSNDEQLEHFFSRVALLHPELFAAQDLVYRATISWDDNDWMGMYFRFNGDSGDPFQNDYYYLKMKASGSPDFVLHRVVDGVEEQFASARAPIINQGDTHTVEIRAVEEEITILFDGEPVPDFDPFVDSAPLLGPGRVGVGQQTNPGYFDNLAFENLEAPQGVSLKPGDVTGDGTLNITDPVLHLGFLFASEAIPECYVGPGASELTEAGWAILDFNGDGENNITDPVSSLTFLFSSGPAHVLGEDCASIPGGCAETCR